VQRHRLELKPKTADVAVRWRFRFQLRDVTSFDEWTNLNPWHHWWLW